MRKRKNLSAVFYKKDKNFYLSKQRIGHLETRLLPCEPIHRCQCQQHGNIVEFISRSCNFFRENLLLFVEKSDTMVNIKNIYFYEVKYGCKL